MCPRKTRELVRPNPLDKSVWALLWESVRKGKQCLELVFTFCNLSSICHWFHYMQVLCHFLLSLWMYSHLPHSCTHTWTPFFCYDALIRVFGASYQSLEVLLSNPYHNVYLKPPIITPHIHRVPLFIENLIINPPPHCISALTIKKWPSTMSCFFTSE